MTATVGALTDDVADLAVNLLIAVCRGLCTGDRYVRDGQWGISELPLASKFSGMHVGIMGLAGSAALAPRAKTRTAMGEWVAEHTVTVIGALAKRVALYDRATRDGRWEIRNSDKTVDLDGKILGLLGISRIGSNGFLVGVRGLQHEGDRL